jgi:hypothetical protein
MGLRKSNKSTENLLKGVLDWGKENKCCAADAK